MEYTPITFTKTIARTYHRLWSKPDFTTFTDEFIRIRKNMGDCEEDFRCFMCDKPHVINEGIGLACFREVGNKVICNDCAMRKI